VPVDFVDRTGTREGEAMDSIGGEEAAVKQTHRLTPEQQRLVIDNQGLARQIAMTHASYIVSFSYSHTHFHAKRLCVYEDILDTAWIGLCAAARKFDPTRTNPKDGKPIKFSTYASWCIRGAIREGIQSSDFRICARTTDKRFKYRVVIDMSEMMHGALRNHYDASALEVFDSRGPGNEYSDDEEPKIKAELIALMSLVLTGREIQIIRECIFEDRTLESMGKELGVTKERVRQIKERALNDLRECPAFIHALDCQMMRHRRELNFQDFHGLVGRLVA
jgi:RNA polymerase sigma factor (sigma-70 family)